MGKLFWLLAVSAVSLLPAGCDSSGTRMYQVSGTVLFDGAPLPEGDIVFQPVAKELGPDAGKIKDGKYELRVKEGSKKVEIRASKMMPLPPGKRGAMGETSEPVDYIPARYNDKTELTAEVTRKGPNQFDFKLQSR